MSIDLSVSSPGEPPIPLSPTSSKQVVHTLRAPERKSSRKSVDGTIVQDILRNVRYSLLYRIFYIGMFLLNILTLVLAFIFNKHVYEWLSALEVLLTIFFALEVLFRAGIEKSHFWCVSWNLVDVAVLLLCVVSLSYDYAWSGEDKSIDSAQDAFLVVRYSARFLRLALYLNMQRRLMNTPAVVLDEEAAAASALRRKSTFRFGGPRSPTSTPPQPLSVELQPISTSTTNVQPTPTSDTFQPPTSTHIGVEVESSSSQTDTSSDLGDIGGIPPTVHPPDIVISVEETTTETVENVGGDGDGQVGGPEDGTIATTAQSSQPGQRLSAVLGSEVQSVLSTPDSSFVLTSPIATTGSPAPQNADPLWEVRPSMDVYLKSSSNAAQSFPPRRSKRCLF